MLPLLGRLFSSNTSLLCPYFAFPHTAYPCALSLPSFAKVQLVAVSEQDLGKKQRVETCSRQPKGFCITGTLLDDTGYPRCCARSFA